MMLTRCVIDVSACAGEYKGKAGLALDRALSEGAAVLLNITA